MPATRSHGLSAGAAAQSFLLRAMSAQGHRRNSGDINLTDMRDRGEGDMDEFTAKTDEIRRLHEVCRAKNDVVRQAYRLEIERARAAHHLYLHERRVRSTHQHACVCIRDEYLHAARVLKDVLKELEGSTHAL